MDNTNFFKHFQRSKNFEKQTENHPKIFFQIVFENYGASLSVVNQQGQEIEPDYQAHSGIKRNILKAMEQIKDRNSFVIDWEKPGNRVFLNEHPSLMEQLRETSVLVDAKMEPLHFQDGEGRLQLRLFAEKQKETPEGKIETLSWKSEIGFLFKDKTHPNFQIITEDTVLVDQQIFKLESLGEGFKDLSYFTTEVAAQDLILFLSIFYSYLNRVELLFEDYQLIREEENIYAQPALIFEKIDEDDALFMRVGQVLPGLSIGTLEQFDLARYAVLNELERTITVKYVEQESTAAIISSINKLLKKHIPRARKGERQEVVLEGDLLIIPKEVASNFIYQELPRLLISYQIFGAEKLKSYKISTKQPSLGFKLSHGIDFLEGEVNLDFGDEKISLFDAITQFKKNHYIKLNDGTHAVINGDYLKKLERIFKQKGTDQVQISFFDLPLVEELIQEKIHGNSFNKARSIFAGFNDVGKEKPNLPALNATLRPYQENGYQWIKYLHDNELGGCLADDMGLGKTLQAIGILASVYPAEQRPSLIVMPRSLLFNWNAEVEKFAPQLSCYTYYGNTRDLAKAQEANLIFTTYALMRNDIKAMKDISFYYVILDESQNIKNLQALTTKAVMLLQSEHRLALSGTPIENNLGELYSLFRFLNPAMFGSVQRFNENYLTPIQKDNDKEAIQQLRKKIYPFILRRLKKDVLKDLPDKIEQTLFVEMSVPQRRLYEQRRNFYKEAIDTSIASRGMQQSRFFIFQALNELRQIASTPENFSDGKILSPKRELLQQQLMDGIANGHKILIFVNFLAAVELISTHLEDSGIDHVVMTGATRNRQALVERFQTDTNCKVFLMTLKTGGTGLNLTAADTIYIFDPWWNVSAENQAIDRAHRIGQQNKVLAYKLITEGSIEEKIVQLQEKKKELFDNIISADGSSMKSLSEDDIDFIFS
ncbi:MAG: SNF2-related protein [Saprospiraceae bacterium]